MHIHIVETRETNETCKIDDKILHQWPLCHIAFKNTYCMLIWINK